ncbi:MAG: Spy/CpxP family protein refolding chaperone [Candidatus Binatia bacterium]
MKKRTIAILAIAILAVGAAFVVAQKAMHHGFGGHGTGFGRMHGPGLMLRGLNLTDDQKAKVKGIMDAGRTTVKPIMQSLGENHKKMEDLTANGAFDEAQVQALATEQANLMAKMIVERERTKSQVFAILTDDQKAKAAQMKEQMKEHFKNRMKGSGETEKAPAGSEL